LAVIDFEFRNSIIQHKEHLGKTLAYCYQCATCSGVCPVAQVTKGRYNPRKLILNSLLGLKDNLLLGAEDNFNIWGCQVCDTCDEMCPQNVELTEVFVLLKNMSVKEGQAPDYYITQAKFIQEHGKAIPLAPAIERRRDQMNLPKAPKVDKKEVQALLKETGLEDIIGPVEKKEENK
jgi:heterodisulfide reductase subunit C